MQYRNIPLRGEAQLQELKNRLLGRRIVSLSTRFMVLDGGEVLPLRKAEECGYESHMDSFRLFDRDAVVTDVRQDTSDSDDGTESLTLSILHEGTVIAQAEHRAEFEEGTPYMSVTYVQIPVPSEE